MAHSARAGLVLVGFAEPVTTPLARALASARPPTSLRDQTTNCVPNSHRELDKPPPPQKKKKKKKERKKTS